MENVKRKKFNTKIALMSLVVFLTFPFPVIQMSYKNLGSTCAKAPEGYVGCNDVIRAMYEPEKYDHIVLVRNVIPGYILDKQLRECLPGDYYPLDKCISYKNQSFYKYAPYYSLVLPLIASITLYVVASKRRQNG